MGIFDRAIKKGVSRAVGNSLSDAVEKKVTSIIAPKVNQQVDRAAQAVSRETETLSRQLDESGREIAAANRDAQAAAAASGTNLGSAFGSFASMMQNYANEAAKNMKTCPSCGEVTSAEIKFCPKCGAKMPEITIAQGAACPKCGKQNEIGTKFCADCGTKLPAAIAEEGAEKAKFDAELAKWETYLPQYPRWSFGGRGMEIEYMGQNESGDPTYSLRVDGTSRRALDDYRNELKQNGFTKAGEYPSEDMLYKMIGGKCYFFESCEPFGGGDDCMSVGFGVGEPRGGFNYKKPEPKAQASFRDLFRR